MDKQIFNGFTEILEDEQETINGGGWFSAILTATSAVTAITLTLIFPPAGAVLTGLTAIGTGATAAASGMAIGNLIEDEFRKNA